jgi:hypothetical protein
MVLRLIKITYNAEKQINMNLVFYQGLRNYISIYTTLQHCYKGYYGYKNWGNFLF